ncbi:MAG: formylglycine-generating enzyme family protein [Bacteroidales bacterium]|nr:formylglycine-generating enzyme family protein [Bacteroidales bacterium]
MNKIFRSILFSFAISICLKGNNLIITNITRSGSNNDLITFNVSWENSWYVQGLPSNHDAIWVFIKFRECNTSGQWNHALLSTNMLDHSLSAGLAFAQPITTVDRWGNPGSHNTGAMIRRSNYGTGNIVNETVTLRVVGSTSGVPFNASTNYDIKVFGIEMVYIPEGPFYVGDGQSTYALFTPGTNPRAPYRVTSEASQTIATGLNGYPCTLPATFPKGYSSFYIMKYEITQGQYVDFLNTIDPAHAISRSYIYNGNMYNIQLTGGTYTTTQPNRAMIYLSFVDLLSYLDWAALRPITEMEYEKACRGPKDFVMGEYAWGTTSFIEAINFSGTTSGQEVCNNVGANLHFYGTSYNCSGGMFGSSNSGPVEVGVFARDNTTSREGTGAGYYGAMELSGNVWEMCIQVNVNNNNPNTSSSYMGIWGDGMLNNAGSYNVTSWPTVEWFCYKGGSWTSHQDRCRVSDRNDIGYGSSYYNSRYNNSSGRGSR